MVHTVTVAGGRFAPGHLGELTQIVPFEMVDAVVAETARVQRRVRDLPSRVVVYLLLAAALFAECGYRQVWARLTAALDGLPVATPSVAGLAAARRRVGAAPLAALFDLLRGPVAGPATRGVWWRGRLVCALDGTTLCCPDTPANLAVYRKGGGYQGGTGYPMVRLAALVACGTRALLAAAFGPTSIDERTYVTRDLLTALGPGMLVLGDRNFGYRPMITAVAETGADVLVRVKASHRLPVCRRCADGSWLSRIGPREVRVLRAQITIATTAGRRSELYQLVTTVTEPDCAADLVRLYHQRWEIETAYAELKQSILGGRVLRARTPAGLEQEIYALLVVYQVLRIAICDATISRPDVDPDRGSFTVALHAARDQLIQAAGVITDTTVDLVGVIGRQVLDHLLPDRRCRTTPRVVKRAISKHAAHAARGRLHGPSYRATISIEILTDPDP